MNTPDSQEIIRRFFSALEQLKQCGAIRGKATFAKRYGINRRNFYLVEKNFASSMFQPAWLSYLVEDYGISAAWLLTGRGEIAPQKPQKPARDLHGKTPQT